MLHPPPGGWSQAADYVVFADRRGVTEGKGGGDGSDCQGGQRRKFEVEELLLKNMEELEKKLAKEVEARVELEGKVVELDRIVTMMREEASVEANRRRSRSRSLSKDSRRSSSKTSRRRNHRSTSRPSSSGVRGEIPKSLLC